MSTTTWLYALLTLSAAVGISYFLGFKPGSGISKVLAATALNGSPSGSEQHDATHDQPPTQDYVEGDAMQDVEEEEIDRRLPPTQDQCLCCLKKVEELGKPMLRCSQCKNAFYCNNVCQKQEWKRHKFNCSLFPPEGLKPARILITKELVDEVRRVDEILKAWLDRVSELTNGLQENVEKINAADLPEALPICRLELIPQFQYKNLPQLQLERHPFRNPIIQIARLYLIALVASHPNPQHRKLLADKLTSVTLPTHLAPLYGPKVMSRPADLSPGEYDTFAEIAPAVMVEPEKVGMDESERGRWIALAVAMKKLWNAGLAPRTAGSAPAVTP
ncbi:hypothetical protein NP233_g7414 [Leucocoprinus birnbaumii]|uniref:MYND-type domain-containing protein n=1 Tax=Leucocoprinus birnbaumii TaxID=56174 RepID=A0AAD5YP17_9AGAR|nr:hypothetical protein NP233_g7414 [Leucocoprinus birnbaumii]